MMKSCSIIWVLKLLVPQNGWFTMENPMQIANLGAPLFLDPPSIDESAEAHEAGLARSIWAAPGG